MEVQRITNSNQTRIKRYNLKNKQNLVSGAGNYITLNYPSNYYVSFGAKKTPKYLLQYIDENDFPSNQIYQTVKNAYKNDSNFSLYDAHIKYYSDILECKSLDEAKEKYPEFSCVLDAKDINYSDMSYTLKQILRGEAEIKIEDLSLELLKRYYGQALPFSDTKKQYFGYGIKAIKGLFEILNIPFMDKKYSTLLYNQQSERLQTISLKTREYMEKHPERKLQHSEFMKEYCARDDVQARMHSRKCRDEEERVHCCALRKKYYSEHPEIGKAHGQFMKQYYIDHPERREEISEKISRFNLEHPEYGLLQSYIYIKIFPDYVQRMTEIAKEFPAIGVIRQKEETGIPLTDSEKSYNKKYFARCMKEYPDIHKQIGRTFSYSIKMFGISTKCDSKKKIEELNEFFNDSEKVKNLMLQTRGYIVE